MPRKINHGLDYDEAYDDYEDYNYDYDYEIEDNVKASELTQEAVKPRIWRCSICTYDNDESMSACDICGVLRNPLINSHYNSHKTVEGIYKGSGASKIAKSLFASLPDWTPKKAVVLQMQKDGFVTGEGNDFQKLGNIQGDIHEFHKAFSSNDHYKINIAPFKFDTPSPDDVVSSGLGSSKTGLKVTHNDNQSKKGSASSSTRGSVKSSDVPSTSMPKGNHSIVEQRNYANSSAAKIQSNDKRPNNSSISDSKGIHEGDQSAGSSVSGGAQQSLTTTLNSLSLDAKSRNPNNLDTKKSCQNMHYKPDKWMVPDQAQDELIQLNLAIVGHVDSGKSTLSGRLLHLLGRISQKEMHKYEKEAKLLGKGSFAYAWALDESTEERERGITMTVAVAYFDSKRYHVVVLDSPGHKDFVPNMISGATQADAAILVIDASIGAFEAGMDGSKGQTKEHAQLIRSFGVDQIIIVVNKLDVVAYSKDRFDLIKQQLGTFLRSCGFKDSFVSWIPLSAIENQNLVAAPSDIRFLSWYQGPNLLDAIDSLHSPSRDFSKPLLMPICDVIKLPSMGHVSACGKLEAGALRNGSKVLIVPSGNIGTVRSLERDSEACSIARAGDNVAVTLQGIDGNDVMAGGVLCHPDFPVSVAKHLEVKVLLLDVATPILIGSQVEFHIHHVKEPARVAKILLLLDLKTGKVAKKNPRCLTAKQSAVIEVILHGPVCVEEFSKCRALGRVFLRALGRTVAVGIITKIIQ